jgi:hypothetical protein
MSNTLHLEKMNTVEKLRALEAIWEDLHRNEAGLESPEWHGQVLRERDERYKSGKEKPIDLEVAKEQLRKLK